MRQTSVKSDSKINTFEYLLASNNFEESIDIFLVNKRVNDRINTTGSFRWPVPLSG